MLHAYIFFESMMDGDTAISSILDCLPSFWKNIVFFIEPTQETSWEKHKSDLMYGKIVELSKTDNYKERGPI